MDEETKKDEPQKNELLEDEPLDIEEILYHGFLREMSVVGAYKMIKQVSQLIKASDLTKITNANQSTYLKESQVLRITPKDSDKEILELVKIIYFAELQAEKADICFSKTFYTEPGDKKLASLKQYAETEAKWLNLSYSAQTFLIHHLEIFYQDQITIPDFEIVYLPDFQVGVVPACDKV